MCIRDSGYTGLFLIIGLNLVVRAAYEIEPRFSFRFSVCFRQYFRQFLNRSYPLHFLSKSKSSWWFPAIFSDFFCLVCAGPRCTTNSFNSAPQTGKQPGNTNGIPGTTVAPRLQWLMQERLVQWLLQRSVQWLIAMVDCDGWLQWSIAMVNCNGRLQWLMTMVDCNGQHNGRCTG